MAAHDFNQPCTCKECRTTYDHHDCPSCGFTTTVEVLHEVEWEEDHKSGKSFPLLGKPLGETQDLACYSCSASVGTFTYSAIDKGACERTQKRLHLVEAGKVCAECSAVEEIDYRFAGVVKLRRRGGRLLCQACMADEVMRETPDPSDDQTKYEFDRTALKWVPERVKVACEGCGRQRWLLIENRWKTRCMKCYKAGLPSAPDAS